MNSDQIVYISIDKLVFDPDNPRLPQTLRRKKDTHEYEKEVMEWMLRNENVAELMGSIGEQGYFAAEPILVAKNEKDQYEVIEGNRRLTAVKLLNDPTLATKKRKLIEEIILEIDSDKIPEKIPSIVFPSRDKVLSYIGYKHITGVEAWDSLAKAKYLKQLLHTLPKDEFYRQCKTLAKIIGSKANYVRLLLVGVEAYYFVEEKNFFDIKDLNEESFEFGVFYTALQRSNIANYVGINFDSQTPTEHIDKDALKDLVEWIFEKNSENATRLGESRNLSKLNKILDNKFPKALAAFKDEKRPLDEAVRLTDHPLEIFQNSLNDSMSALEIARNYLHQVESPTEAQADSLKEIHQLAPGHYFKLLIPKSWMQI